MNAVSRKNLTGARAVDANNVDTAGDADDALDDGKDRAQFRRTIATCIWGVSDPLPTGPGTGSGGWQRGSLTPQMPPSPALTAAPTATRAAKKRRPLDRGEVADRKQHRHFTSVTQSRCSAAS